jgi:osmotically-inducible protein OsmY
MRALQLRQDILDELEYEPSIDAAHIGVTVDHGVVTLSGHVSNYGEKLAVVQAVRRVKGVSAIAEEIQVRFPDHKKTTDDEIAKRVVDILGWDTLIPRNAVQILVREGWVTLAGNVEYRSARVAANDVKRKIEDALKRHAEIEAGAIRVSVDDGSRVVLEGNVHSWGERQAAENAAWSAPGEVGRGPPSHQLRSLQEVSQC